MKLVATTEAVKIAWFVWAGGEKFPREASMRGYVGFDAKCSCGWETKSGGGVRSWIEQEVLDHKSLEHGYEWVQSEPSKRTAALYAKYNAFLAEFNGETK